MCCRVSCIAVKRCTPPAISSRQWNMVATSYARDPSRDSSFPARLAGENLIVHLEHCPTTTLEIHHAAEPTKKMRQIVRVKIRGLPAVVLRGKPVMAARGLRLSSVFRVLFCPGPGFHRRLDDQASASCRMLISSHTTLKTSSTALQRSPGGGMLPREADISPLMLCRYVIRRFWAR